MNNNTNTNTVKIAYVTGNQGDHYFEIHAAGCAHLRKLHPWADVTIHEVDDVDEFVADEVDTYQYQDQGYIHDDFKVFGCARKAEAASNA